MSLVMVDDHPLYADVLAGALHDLGHEVFGVCDDLESTLVAVRRYRPTVCVVDLDLAGYSGLEVADAVRRNSPDTAVVVLTGASGSEIQAALEHPAVDAVVSKDCDLVALDGIIRTIRPGSPVVVIGWRPHVPAHRGTLKVPPVELTERETEILRLLYCGLGNQVIADALCVSVNTVRKHLHNLFAKLEVHTRARAIQRGLDLGLLPRIPRQRTSADARDAG